MATPKRKLGTSFLSNARVTPYNRRNSSSGKCYTPFKSPSSNLPKKKNEARGQSPDVLSEKEKIKLAQNVVQLNQMEMELDKEIEELKKKYSVDDLQVYIDKLHEYNDIKDVAQVLLGRLAEVEGTTTRSLYERFELDLDD